jgi:hypothetical protein
MALVPTLTQLDRSGQISRVSRLARRQDRRWLHTGVDAQGNPPLPCRLPVRKGGDQRHSAPDRLHKLFQAHLDGEPLARCHPS